MGLGLSSSLGRGGAILLGLLAAGCAADQGGPATRAPARPTLETAAARLPAEVAGFRKGETLWHERTTPGLGITADYAGPARAAVATASLYDRGLSAPDAGALEREFATAVEEVLAAAGGRTSQRIENREGFSLPAAGGEALRCARFEGSYGRMPVRTVMCLGEAAGRFLKVQVTSPARQVRPVEPLPFVAALAEAVRTGG